MQCRREFFNRLAVLCGAAAVAPVAAKALTVENLSDAIVKLREHTKPLETGRLYLLLNDDWVEIAQCHDIKIDWDSGQDLRW
jgi:hypothetical protein